MKRSIYEGEGSTNTLERKETIEAALAQTTKGVVDRKIENGHALSVRAIAMLLQKIGEYNTKPGFDDQNGNVVYYVQQMALDLEEQLQHFVSDSTGWTKESDDYKQRLKTFNQNCEKIIAQNIEGVSREPTWFNVFAPLINRFLKIIGREPYKLDTTDFAKNQAIHKGFSDLSDAGVGKEKIDEIDSGNDYPAI